MGASGSLATGRDPNDGGDGARSEEVRPPRLAPAPNVIWTYWHQMPVPPVVARCIASWARFHPNMAVTVVTQATAAGLLGLGQGVRVLRDRFQWLDSVTREADLVRLMLLAKFGGVWLDASFLLDGRLTFFDGVVGAKQPAEYGGYHLRSWGQRNLPPVIENWAMAARPGSPFVHAWLQEMLSVPNVPDGVQRKLDHYLQAGVDLQGIIWPHYLLMHVAAQAVLQGKGTVGFRGPYPAQGRIQVQAAEDGPYKYLVKAGWNSDAAVREVAAVMRGSSSGSSSGNVFKMRGCERAALERLLPAGTPTPAP